jgi:hypothetical protein
MRSDSIIEMRNRIYQYASIPDETMLATKKKRKCKGLDNLPLTQVCRQLRQEYLPIQRRNSRVRVKWTEATDYLATFHGGSTPTLQELIITLKPLSIRDSRAGEPFEILPLIKLRLAMPYSSIEFKSRTSVGDLEYYAWLRICEPGSGRWRF